MSMEIPKNQTQGEKAIQETGFPQQKADITKIQSQIIDILNRPFVENQPIEKFVVPSTYKLEGGYISDHDRFLSLLKSQMKGKKILDIFCGHNAPKKFLQKESDDTEVTGVDLVHEEADIKGDVAEIEKLIKPKKQFDYLFNFGGIAQYENYEVLRNYIKDEGFFVENCSKWWFQNVVAPVLANEESTCQKEPEEAIKSCYFQPLAVVGVEALEEKEGEPLEYQYTQEQVYIIWKKRMLPIPPKQEYIERAKRRKEITAEREKEGEDLTNADTVEKILTEGSLEDLERLQLFHNLDKEKIGLWSRFAKLRKRTLSEMKERFKKRITGNPEPTNEEWKIGVYEEEIEPQVLDAMKLMRKKGYNTFESGFYGSEMQKIGFEGEPLKGVELPSEIIELANQSGLDVKISPDSIKLRYRRYMELDEMKKVWDAIADYLPELGQAAGSPSNEAVQRFQKRVENIKRDPKPFIED